MLIIEEQIENLNRKIEIIKQMKLLELENVIS